MDGSFPAAPRPPHSLYDVRICICTANIQDKSPRWGGRDMAAIPEDFRHALGVAQSSAQTEVLECLVWVAGLVLNLRPQPPRLSLSSFSDSWAATLFMIRRLFSLYSRIYHAARNRPQPSGGV